MRVTTADAEWERMRFAVKAANAMALNSNMTTYTDRVIEPGCLFAVRWGLGNDSVLVLRLDEFFEPVIYGQIIKEPQPASEGPP